MSTTSIRVDRDLYIEATKEGEQELRSGVQQYDYWAKIRRLVSKYRGLPLALIESTLKFEPKDKAQVSFLDKVQQNGYTELKLQAMALYTFIKAEELSVGMAVCFLGMSKTELIQFYGSMGIAYFDQNEAELDADIDALERINSI